MKNKITYVGFTKDAYEALKRAGASDEIFKGIADIVANRPKGKYKVDAFDGLSWACVRLSWLRNWETGKAWVMTIAEAMTLDGNVSNRYEPPFDIPFKIDFLF